MGDILGTLRRGMTRAAARQPEPAAPPPPGPSRAQRNLNVVAYVDTIDVCQLKCPTCVRGIRGMENSAKTMPLETFARIVGKISSEGYKYVALYNWTEPFLNPRLAEYVAIVKSHGLACWVSTNFSLRRIPALEAVLRNGLDLLNISVSGFDQEIYEINHKAGHIDCVKENARRAAALKHSIPMAGRVRLRFIKFPYNHDQEAKLAAFAQELGIEFEVITGSGDPLSEPAPRDSDFFETLVASARSERPFDAPGKVCPLMFGQLVVNHAGKVSLCCSYPQHEVLQVGAYLDLPQEEILLRRYAHPMCHVCREQRRDATPDDTEALLQAVRYRMAV